MSKIIDSLRLAEKLRKARIEGRTIVQCHGCFDVVHPGHIQYLRFARGLGQILVVSLTGDANINKGVDRPYIPQDLRAENLAALELVDYVVIDPHPTACELLELLRPDFYVKGEEYARSTDARFMREREIVERNGGRVVFHGGDVVFSSTRLLESIGREPSLDAQRLRGYRQRNRIDDACIARMLERFPGVPVAVIGDWIREEYVLCDASAAAEDAPLVSATRLGAQEYVGGAALVALQMRALGARPRLITASADDDASRFCAEVMDRAGVELDWIRNRRSAVRRTTHLADDHKLFRLVDGACCPLDSGAERAIAARLSEFVRKSALIVWCDYGFGMITPGLVRAVQAMNGRPDVVVAGWAGGPRGRLSVLEGTDLITGTERQIRESMHDLGSGMASVVWNALSQTKGRSAIVSVRRRGMVGFDGRAQECQTATVENPHGEPRPDLERLRSDFVPAFPGHELDLLGVDECVLAAAALALHAADSVPLSTYVAAAAESLSAGRGGPTTFDLRELRKMLLDHGREDHGRFVADPVPPARSVRFHNEDLEAAPA